MVHWYAKTRFPQAFRVLLVGAAMAGAAWLALVPEDRGADLSGFATAVDGDTLALAGKRVRLLGIDAPESDQTCHRPSGDWTCGRAASERLAQAIRRAETICRPEGHDRYGRILAHCTSAGRDLSALMVSEGLAVARDEYLSVELRARVASRGIWGGEFVDPRAWRQGHAMAGPQQNVLDWLRSLLGS